MRQTIGFTIHFTKLMKAGELSLRMENCPGRRSSKSFIPYAKVVGPTFLNHCFVGLKSNIRDNC